MYHCGWSTSSSSPASASASGCYELSNKDHHCCSSSQPLLCTSPHASPSMPLRRVLILGEEEEEAPRTPVAPVGRYSAEERRERIDKYRSKRNQRNFDKKITYACRKALADSRPRVKGRFARNSADNGAAEAELTEAEVSVSPTTTSTAIPCNANVPEWWPAMQEALVRQEQEADLHLCDVDDDELLAAYLGVSSIDLYSPRGH